MQKIITCWRSCILNFLIFIASNFHCHFVRVVTCASWSPRINVSVCCHSLRRGSFREPYFSCLQTTGWIRCSGGTYSFLLLPLCHYTLDFVVRGTNKISETAIVWLCQWCCSVAVHSQKQFAPFEESFCPTVTIVIWLALKLNTQQHPIKYAISRS